MLFFNIFLHGGFDLCSFFLPSKVTLVFIFTLFLSLNQIFNFFVILCLLTCSAFCIRCFYFYSISTFLFHSLFVNLLFASYVSNKSYYFSSISYTSSKALYNLQGTGNIPGELQIKLFLLLFQLF